MNEFTLQKRADTFRKTILERYVEDRQWELSHPLYLLFKNDDLFKIVPLDMPREMAKVMRDALAAACDAFGVNFFMYVSEGWMKRVTPQEEELEKSMPKDEEGMPIRKSSLREDPTSIEILLITVGERGGERLHESWSINRDAEKPEDILKLESRYTSDDPHVKSISHWDLWERPSLKKEIDLEV